MTSDFNFGAELVLETSAFNQAIANAEKSLKELQSSARVSSDEFSALEKEIKTITGTAQEMAADIKSGAMSGHEAATAFRTYTGILQDTTREMKQLTQAASEMNQLQSPDRMGLMDTGASKEIAKNLQNWHKLQQGITAETQATEAAIQKAAQEQAKVTEQALAPRQREAENMMRDEARVASQVAQERINAQIAEEQRYADAAKSVRDANLTDHIQAEEAKQQAHSNRIRAQMEGDAATARAAQDQLFSTGAEEGGYADNIRYSESLARVNKEQQEFERNLANTRYALYDVSRSLTVVSAASLGAVTAGLALAGSMEQAFTHVERNAEISGERAQELRRALVDLTTAMPEDFGAVTQIASLGAQLGIAEDQLESFSDTITRFAATTNVTVEGAAEGLGRLGELTKTPVQEFENMASSIYQVGITSVATETAILATAQQIAVSGEMAGFANHEVIALAGALASLGIQPEAARGSMMRIFNTITKAVSEGGDALEQFASKTTMTTDQIQDLWDNGMGGSQEVFNSFITGLQNAGAEGENLMGILQDLGVGAIRDQRALLSLANNTEVYATALEQANNAYISGTATSDAYAKVADDLNSRLTMLVNVIKAIVDEGMGPLLDIISPLVQGLVNLGERMLEIVRHPVGAALFSIVAGATALVGIIAGLGAAAVASIAGLYGLVTGMRGLATAMTETNAGSSRLNIALRSVAVEMWGVVRATAAGSASMRTFTSVANAKTAATGAAAAATRGLSLALRSIPGVAAISAAVWGLSKAVDAFSSSAGNASRAAENIFGGVDDGSFAAAIRADTEAMENGADAYRTFQGTMQDTTPQLADWAQELENSTGGQVGLTETTREATGALKEQEYALGENARAWVANRMANSEELQNLYRDNVDTMRDLGVDMSEAIEQGLRTAGGAEAYITEFVDNARSRLAELRAELATTDYGSQRHQQLTDEYNAIQLNLGSYEQLLEIARALDLQLAEGTSEMELQQAVAAGLGITVDELEESFDGAAEASTNFADGLFDNINAIMDTENAMHGLLESLHTSSGEIDMFSEDGQAAMNALETAVNQLAVNAGDDSVGFANNLADMFAMVEGSGYELGNEVDFLRSILVDTFNETYGIDLDISDARQSIHQFIADAIAAVEARAELERQYVESQRTAGDPSRPTFFAEAAGSYRGQPSMLPQLDSQLASLRNLQTQLTRSGEAGQRAGQQIARNMQQAERASGGAGRGARNAGNAARNAGRQARQAGRDAADGAREAQEEVRTLTDWANDLNTVWQRAFDIRFGVQNARDATADLWQRMRDGAAAAAEAIRDARQRIRELRAELGTLAADRTVLQYQLSVAVEYGDDLRAAQLRAELAENNSQAASTTNDLKDANRDLKSAQDDTSTSLSGNSRASRENRQTVQELMRAYQAEIIAMAESGATSAQLQARTAQLRAEFVRQLTQMGYNRAEVNRYAKSFDDMRVIINRVPRNITVRANARPAQQALNEFIARNRNRQVNVRANMTGLPRSVSGGQYRPSSIRTGSGGLSTPRINVGNRINTPSVDTRNVWVANRVQQRGGGGGGAAMLNASGGLIPQYLAGGGHAAFAGGPKGTDTIPSWLTPGEFVQRKAAVDHYGLPFMNALNNLQLPRYFAGGGPVVATGGSGGGSPQLVELMPHQINQIIRGVSTQVTIGDRQVANSTNRANTNNARRGSA